MSDHTPLRHALSAFTILAGLGLSLSALAANADRALYDNAIPPLPSQDQVNSAAPELGSPLNNPVTGSSSQLLIIGGDRPPSLESLQAPLLADARVRWQGRWLHRKDAPVPSRFFAASAKAPPPLSHAGGGGERRGRERGRRRSGPQRGGGESGVRGGQQRLRDKNRDGVKRVRRRPRFVA